MFGGDDFCGVCLLWRVGFCGDLPPVVLGLCGGIQKFGKQWGVHSANFPLSPSRAAVLLYSKQEACFLGVLLQEF